MVSGECFGACGGCRTEIEDCGDSVNNDRDDEDRNEGVADATAAVEGRGLAGWAATARAASVFSSSCTSSPFIMPP